MQLGDNIVLLNLNCALSSGCLFSGNDKSAEMIEAAFNGARPMGGLDLTLSEKDEFSGQVYSGAWTSIVPISFLSVKAADQFMLYQLAQPTTSGSWSTAGLVNSQGIAHAVSHISLWTSPFTPPPVVDPLPPGPPVVVPPEILHGGGDGSLGGLASDIHGDIPEPAAWISMILGLGGIGTMLRRRRSLATA